MRVLFDWALLIAFTASSVAAIHELLGLGMDMSGSSTTRFFVALGATILFGFVIWFLQQGRTYEERQQIERAERDYLRQKGAPVE